MGGTRRQDGGGGFDLHSWEGEEGSSTEDRAQRKLSPVILTAECLFFSITSCSLQIFYTSYIFLSTRAEKKSSSG